MLWKNSLNNLNFSSQISDHQQSWGVEDGPWKEPESPLLVAADFSEEKSSIKTGGSKRGKRGVWIR